ncbi:MAG: outer membrane protein assembly factor BamE [Methylococcales symbiont of Hymedesmia sp. n. MRB-2018]|nr:MAG: outer membrane protein assembly factor BamE [Methylococcales symbiont of Hymedesmia sp. n. MRB-2018]
MRNTIYLFVLVASITLSSCSTIMNNIPSVYLLKVQQGNIINQDMVDQLRPNMTKRQVLYILGSSMLVDVFHQKRWDYLYSTQASGEQKRLSLFFDGDVLISVQGDLRPSTLAVARKSNKTTFELPKRELDKTLWGKMKRLMSEDEPASTETSKYPPANDSNQSASDNPLTIATEEQETETPSTKDDMEADNTSEKQAIDDQASGFIDKTEQEISNSEISITPLQENQPQVLEPIQNEGSE